MTFTKQLGSRKIAALSAIALIASAVSSAKADYTYSYNISFPAGSPGYTIDNWYVLEIADGGVINGANLGLRLPFTPISSPTGGTLDADFPVPDPATGALLMGITQDLPGDAPGQKHIVLGMDTQAASLAEDIAWGTLFRNTDEDTLIYSLEHYIDPDQTITQNALQFIDDYAYGDATTGILDSLAQPHTAFFDPAAGAFAIESWSTGTLLGTGSVTVNIVPEPATLGVLAALAASALLRRTPRDE